MDKDEKNRIKCNLKKVTQYLEKCEIWFKTIFSLAVTIAALFISIVSCNNAAYQAQLSAAVIEREDREKQPFFSVEQIYNEEQEQYIYSIINTGGQVRYCNIQISPYLHIYQYNNDIILESPKDTSYFNKREKNNDAFIYLSGFFNYEENDSNEDVLIAFSDIKLQPADCNGTFEGRVNTNKSQLADEYFSYVTSWNNSDEKNNTHMNSQIVYSVDILYYNYKNELSQESIWLRRSADLSNKTIGNTILFYGNYLDDNYKKANKKKHTYTVDSLNKSKKEVLNECNKYIEEFDQYAFYEPLPLE